MKYCRKCLQPDTRPNIVFDKIGVCPACNYSDQLGRVNWRERFSVLQDLIKEFSQQDGKNFDCIVGVSGGKDSTRQALFLRDKLKLKPLLVCLSYPPHQISSRGADNVSNLIELGFDLVWTSPQPETWRQLVKVSFSKFCNWANPTELALFASVPQMAIRYQIPLVFWGENPGLQLGDMKTLGRSGYDGNSIREMNTLQGGKMEWLFEAGFDAKNLIPYFYPTVDQFEKHNIQIVYLGWFLGDWSLINNGHYSALNGLKIRDENPLKTGDLYSVTALDEDWVLLNQMIKYYKYGFGRATDYVNEEIRQRRLTRDEGIKIVSEFDGRCDDKYVESFCQYIDISTIEFWDVVYGSVNRELFEISKNGQINPKFVVGQ